MTRPRQSFIVLLACLTMAAAAGCQQGTLFDNWGARQQTTQSRTAGAQAASEPADDRRPDAAAELPGTRPPEAGPEEPVNVLQINDDSITVEDILRPLNDDLAARAGTMPLDHYGQYVIQALQSQIRTQARDLLLYQEASRRLTDAEAEMIDNFTDQRIRDIVQKEHGGRHTRWEQAMAEKGLSAEEARERVRRELVVIRHLQSTISPRIQEPTRRELVHYFEQRKDEWATPQRRELFLIEVAKNEDPEAARATAKGLLAELEAGADFAELAREHSTGLRATDGGAWGLVARDSLRSRWATAAEALFELPPDGTSGLVESDECFFIVRVGRIDPGSQPDFAEVQRALTESYRDHQFNVLVDELVVRLQDQATIHPADLSLFLRAVLNKCPTPDGQPLLPPR